MSKETAPLPAEHIMPWESEGGIQQGQEASSLFDAMGSDPELASYFGGDEEPKGEDGDPGDAGESSDADSEEGTDEGRDDDDLLDLLGDEEEEEGLEGDEDADDGDGEEPDERYTVKVDGEEVEVTFEELKAGYSGTQAITKRFQEAAEVKKTAAAEAEQLRGVRAEYVQGLEKLEGILTDAMPAEPDWDTLRAQDPTKFAVEFADWQRQKGQLDKVASLKAQEQKKQQEEYAELHAQHLQAEQVKMVEAIPEWKEPETMKKGLGELRSYAMTTFGYTAQDLDAVTDHRIMVILQKAMERDQLQSKGKKTVTKARKRADKTLKPGARRRGPSKAARKRTASLHRQLSETGDPAVGRAILETLLDD